MRRTLAALALAMALPATGLLAPPVRAQVVVVREGDTLSDIAARHRVSLTRLMQANGISDPDLVVVGQRLTIPGGSARPAASGGGGTVTVQPGDTLSDIAARHGVGVTRLMQANGISDADLVMVGQRLTIPGGSGRSAAPAPPSAQPTAPYTVKSGETLSEIAARFNTSTERLIQLNRIQNPDLLTSGTRLRIPMAPRSSAAPASTPAARPAPNRNAREHVVQGGESLSGIAERYGTSVSQLVALNRIEDPDRLLAGTRLQLRGTPPAAQPQPQPQPATVTATPATATPASAPATQTGRAPTAASQAEPAAAATAAPSPTPQAQPQPEPQPQTVARSQLSPASTPARAATAATASAATAATSTAAARAAGAAATSPAATAATTAAAAATSQSTALQQASARSSTATTAASRIGAATGGVQASAAQTTANTRSTTPAAATTAAARPAPASTATSSGAASAGDWRSYGPLQIDWSKWQAMGGSHVAPSLNSDGKARYLAVNCTARKLNRTTASGQWNSWESPQEDFETKLVQDLCREKGN